MFVQNVQIVCTFCTYYYTLCTSVVHYVLQNVRYVQLFVHNVPRLCTILYVVSFLLISVILGFCSKR